MIRIEYGVVVGAQFWPCEGFVQAIATVAAFHRRGLATARVVAEVIRG